MILVYHLNLGTNNQNSEFVRFSCYFNKSEIRLQNSFVSGVSSTKKNKDFTQIFYLNGGLYKLGDPIFIW